MSYRYSEVKASVDPAIKARAYALMEENGVSPSDFIRSALIRLVESGEMPFKIVQALPGRKYHFEEAAEQV